MLFYWIAFSIPAIGALVSYKEKNRLQIALLYIVSIYYIFLIGFRYEIGCDWENYINHFISALDVGHVRDLGEVSKDIGYGFLNYVMARTVESVWGVNLFAAIVCMYGLVRFCSQQPAPFLALTIAVPYIIIVLFQGYTRQAIAFGFELLALVYLSQVHYKRFVANILLAATFHKTATILLPLAALASSRNKWWTYFWVGITSLFAFFFFVAEYQATLWDTYVVSNYQSSGGGIRIAMNVLPALLFLVFRDRFQFQSEEEKKMWTWVSILSFICVPLVFQSSTAVDRIALYLMPIQIYVFSRLPEVFSGIRGFVTVGIVALYFLVQFVWLNFAHHAHCWVPYQFQIFYEIIEV